MNRYCENVCNQPVMTALFEYIGSLACIPGFILISFLATVIMSSFAHLSKNEVSIQGRRGLGVGELSILIAT